MERNNLHSLTALRSETNETFPESFKCTVSNQGKMLDVTLIFRLLYIETKLLKVIYNLRKNGRVKRPKNE